MVFLPVVFCIYWLAPHRWRSIILLIASYWFYMSWDPWFGLLLAGTTLIDWYAARKIQNEQASGSGAYFKRKVWLWISILTNLGCLAVFKYSAFFVNNFMPVLAGDAVPRIEAFIVPVGLSFYTFQSMSYVIDVYRRQAVAESQLHMFALYVSFFPQLVAGPVERFSHLMPQFREEKKLKHYMLVNGVRLMIWGFFKKIVIADQLHNIVTPLFNNCGSLNALSLFTGSVFFAVQIYCDFSGYSDIAKGTANLFGFDLMINFRRPLLSGSIHEFWSRNHLSMTTWFRDYLYIPLGGNRVSIPRWLLNLFLTFVISGFWHGANWTFLIWGALYGLIYIVEIPVLKFTSGKKWLNFPGWIYLLSIHSLIMISFRAQSAEEALNYYNGIFTGNWSIEIALMEMRAFTDMFPFLVSLLLIVFLFVKEYLEEHRTLFRIAAYDLHIRPWMYVIAFSLIFLLGEFNANEFIYFRF